MPFSKFYVSASDTKNPEQLQRTINTVQQNVQDAFIKIEKNTVLDNVVHKDIVINTATTIDHKLGRVPVGYLILQKNANANIWNGAISENQIALNSSAAVTVTILIFWGKNGTTKT